MSGHPSHSKPWKGIKGGHRERRWFEAGREPAPPAPAGLTGRRRLPYLPPDHHDGRPDDERVHAADVLASVDGLARLPGPVARGRLLAVRTLSEQAAYITPYRRHSRTGFPPGAVGAPPAALGALLGRERGYVRTAAPAFSSVPPLP